MLDNMSSREFAEWMAYNRLEPFGDLRADYRSGMLAALVAQAFGADAKPEDFMLLDQREDKHSIDASVSRFEEMFGELHGA